MEDQRKKRQSLPQKDREDVRGSRLSNLAKKLEENSLDALIVSSPKNKFYLTGWNADSESGWVLVTKDKNYIFTDSRYTEHANKESSGFEIIEYESGLPNFFGDFSKKISIKRVGFESHDLSVFDFKRLKRFAKRLKLTPAAHYIEDFRSVKDVSEVDKLKKAVEIADKAFAHLLNWVKVGMAEKEIAWETEKYMRGLGAEKMAWEPFIVAAGSNASMAHWGAGNRKIKKGDMVLVDYGCVYKGYHSDTTRMFFVGKPTDEQKKIYNLVFEAQKIGENLVQDGKSANAIDKKVRSFLERETKYYYRHGLGHGVGLEVHELPRLSIHSKNKLQVGNTITVEPGIYIPGWGGVRLEDIVVVAKDGCEILTKAPKEVKEITI